jgi:hypothetical protein
MTYVTVGRIGSTLIRRNHFQLMRIGVKVYVPHVTKKGTTVLWYDGCVPGSVTMDRFIRPKAIARGVAYAKENGFIFRDRIVHNDPLTFLEALLCDTDILSVNTQEDE